MCSGDRGPDRPDADRRVRDLDCKTQVLDSDEVGQLRGTSNLMLDGLHEHERVKDMFGRYVSVKIAERLSERKAWISTAR